MPADGTAAARSTTRISACPASSGSLRKIVQPLLPVRRGSRRHQTVVNTGSGLGMPLASALLRNPITGIAGCCARARLILAASNRPAPPSNAEVSPPSVEHGGSSLPRRAADILSAKQSRAQAVCRICSPPVEGSVSPWARPELFGITVDRLRGGRPCCRN